MSGFAIAMIGGLVPYGLRSLCVQDLAECGRSLEFATLFIGVGLSVSFVVFALSRWHPRWFVPRSGSRWNWQRVARRAERKARGNPAYRYSHVEQVALGVAGCHKSLGHGGLLHLVNTGEKARFLEIGALASVIGLPLVTDLMSRAVDLVDRHDAGKPVAPAVKLLEAEFAQMGGLDRVSDAANAHIRKELSGARGMTRATLTQT